MNTKDIIYTILFFFMVFILLGGLIKLIEEKPHKVIIHGKEYIRSKEYVGDGHYQIILLPVDSSSKK